MPFSSASTSQPQHIDPHNQHVPTETTELTEVQRIGDAEPDDECGPSSRAQSQTAAKTIDSTLERPPSAVPSEGRMGPVKSILKGGSLARQQLNDLSSQSESLPKRQLSWQDVNGQGALTTTHK